MVPPLVLNQLCTPTKDQSGAPIKDRLGAPINFKLVWRPLKFTSIWRSLKFQINLVSFPPIKDQFGVVIKKKINSAPPKLQITLAPPKFQILAPPKYLAAPSNVNLVPPKFQINLAPRLEFQIYLAPLPVSQ